MDLRVYRFALLACGFAAVFPPAHAQQVDAAALVRRAMQHRLESDKTHLPLRYQLHKVDASHGVSHVTTKEIIETKDGDVARLIAVDDKPLSPEGERAELDRLNELAEHPEEQAHRHRAEEKDAARVSRLMALLPDAFVFQIEAIEACPSGKCYRLSFRPKPDWTPPDLEADLFRGIAGEAWIDQARERLTKIAGNFIADVDFGLGVLGKLNKGGSVLLEQTGIGNDDWELTSLELHVNGKALLVKTISVQLAEQTSHFSRVDPNLTYRQAILLLKSAP